MEKTEEFVSFSTRSFYGSTTTDKRRTKKRRSIGVAGDEEDTEHATKRPPSKFPSEFIQRILGPTICWQTFYRQTDAFHYAQSMAEDVHVFAFESCSNPTKPGTGQRRYIVSSLPYFWHYYSQLQPDQRQHYEIIPEGSPCKLYFDLEYSVESNPNIDGDAMVELLIKYVCAWLLQVYGIDCDRKDILDLDASTSSKSSRHLIFQGEGLVFENNVTQGNFVRYIFGVLKGWRISPAAADSNDDFTTIGQSTSSSTSSYLAGLEVKEQSSGVKSSHQQCVIDDSNLTLLLNEQQPQLPCDKSKIVDDNFQNPNNIDKDVHICTDNIVQDTVKHLHQSVKSSRVTLSNSPLYVTNSHNILSNSPQTVINSNQIVKSPSQTSNNNSQLTSCDISKQLDNVNKSQHSVIKSQHDVYDIIPKSRDNIYNGNGGFSKTTNDSDVVESKRELEQSMMKNVFNQEELQSLFVKKKDGMDNLFCDLGVYTKNRNFRLYLSSKLNKRNPLKVASENQFTPSSHSKQTNREEDVFYASLVTNVQLSSETQMLRFDTINGSSKVSFPGTNQSGKKDIGSNNSFLWHGDEATLEGWGSSSPYPEIDQYITSLVSGGQGRIGAIRRWNYFPSSQTLVYDIVGYRWCHNVKRQHKSNNIMYVVDIGNGIVYQKCHDPDCQAINYRSPEMQLPEHVLPGYLLESDSSEFHEDHSTCVPVKSTPAASLLLPDGDNDGREDKEENEEGEEEDILLTALEDIEMLETVEELGL